MKKNQKADMVYPVAGVHGSVEKGGAIHRKKIYRDAKGTVIREGGQELYKMAHPRDFTTTPQTPAERAHHERFRSASRLAIDIYRASKPGANPTQEMRQQLAQWQARFEAQLPSNKGSKPDPDAPTDTQTGQKKRYIRLDTFIRAITYYQLKSRR